MNWPEDIWRYIDNNYQYQVINNRDVYVFKWPNGVGAIVSKPLGHYQNKINIWELTPIILIDNQWTMDVNIPSISSLIEGDIPLLLIHRNTLSNDGDNE